MKAHLALAMVCAATFACSSEPSGNPASSAGTSGNGGNSAAGQTATSGGAGAGGIVSSGGSGGAPSAGGAGATSGGAAGANGGSGGTTAGASGAAGMGGSSAGSGGAVDPGNLPNKIPAGYTGTPFGGTPQVIPGKIEIERYDLGGVNVAFKADLGGAFNKCGFTREDALKLQCTQQQGSPQDKSLPGCGVEPANEIYLGYINAGDWYKYTVNVLQAGTYVISGHEGVAGNTQMQFTFTDTAKTGNIPLPSTNQCNNYEAYHVWATHENLGEITLEAGKYVLTINVVAPGMNLDWFAFTKK